MRKLGIVVSPKKALVAVLPVPAAGTARTLLAANMLHLRRQAGLSQEALAFEAGLHRTFICHVERGARNVSIDNLERIALGLNVHPMVLLAPAGALLPGAGHKG